MSIKKTVRFEVFKRDGFQCIYCGQTPPAVVLEVDHIEPKSKGGSDDINNLVTACFDCNRGKRNVPLYKIPTGLSKQAEVLGEKEEQLKEYQKLLKKIRTRIKLNVRDISQIYKNQYQGWRFSDSFKRITLERFLSLLPKQEIEDSLVLAIQKLPNDKDRVIQYFCGICWNKIRNNKKE
ncbi:MAG: HNH endonuclease [Candidatus Omnitrophica bacterium]|nr:HNH endonuclease [Candidatus Omnitrophota bacterium]